MITFVELSAAGRNLCVELIESSIEVGIGSLETASVAGETKLTK